MSVESATYINGLTATNPVAGDVVSEGDDHIRLLKSTIKATFPNVSGAVSATHTQLSYVTGVTSAIQTQLDAKATTAGPTFTGVPAADKAAYGTNTTQLATTSFVYEAIGGFATGAIGTYVMAKAAAVTAIGASIAGTNLQGAGITTTGTQVLTGVGLGGSWRCMGVASNGSDVSLFVRIA